MPWMVLVFRRSSRTPLFCHSRGKLQDFIPTSDGKLPPPVSANKPSWQPTIGHSSSFQPQCSDGLLICLGRPQHMWAFHAYCDQSKLLLFQPKWFTFGDTHPCRFSLISYFAGSLIPSTIVIRKHRKQHYTRLSGATLRLMESTVFASESVNVLNLM
jgi:hypothetical protein